MAQNIIDSLAATDLEEKTKWRGAEEGACPVFHQSVFEVFPGSDKVECTICGIEGKVEVKDGKATYTFCEQQQARSRMKYAGKLEHSNEIKHGAMTQKKVEGLKELMRNTFM